MTAVPPVSVIVPAHNAADAIGEQLAALAGQDHDGPWEVVVVDDGSTDGTAAVVASWIGRVPGLRLLDGGARSGGAVARNVGARAAGGALLLYCDADDVVAPGWVAAMAAGAAASDAELFGGYVDGDRLNGPSAARRRRPYPVDRLPLRLDFLPYATSANFGIRAATLSTLGGWDERYARGGDAELCWRAQLAGRTLRYLPDAVVHYRYRASLPASMRQQFAWGQVDPQLRRDFRDAGFERRPWPRVAASLALVVLSAPKLAAGPAHRSAWLRRTALLAGRGVGSARHRCLYL